MPIMNGVVATQILRSHGISVPIVAVTGNALQEDVEAFQMAGANVRHTHAHAHARNQRDGPQRIWSRSHPFAPPLSLFFLPPLMFVRPF